jgi:hypothetical protein
MARKLVAISVLPFVLVLAIARPALAEGGEAETIIVDEEFCAGPVEFRTCYDLDYRVHYTVTPEMSNNDVYHAWGDSAYTISSGGVTLVSSEGTFNEGTLTKDEILWVFRLQSRSTQTTIFGTLNCENHYVFANGKVAYDHHACEPA